MRGGRTRGGVLWYNLIFLYCLTGFLRGQVSGSIKEGALSSPPPQSARPPGTVAPKWPLRGGRHFGGTLGGTSLQCGIAIQEGCKEMLGNGESTSIPKNNRTRQKTEPYAHTSVRKVLDRCLLCLDLWRK